MWLKPVFRLTDMAGSYRCIADTRWQITNGSYLAIDRFWPKADAFTPAGLTKFPLPKAYALSPLSIVNAIGAATSYQPNRHEVVFELRLRGDGLSY